jgi:hypothetical protein
MLATSGVGRHVRDRRRDPPASGDALVKRGTLATTAVTGDLAAADHRDDVLW